MTSFKTFALAGIAAIALAATPASATELLYDFSSTSGTDDFSFTLDSNPTPDAFTSTFNFQFSGYPVTTGAGAEAASVLRFLFGGGLEFETPSYAYILGGPQLYSGPESSPTMLTGQFALSGAGFMGGAIGQVAGTLSVTELSAAVPEPGTWAMMLIGFGAVGFSMRKARKAKAVLQAA